MSDIIEQARGAREKLAAALSLLQSPDAGTLIDTVAEPVARAMGALHQLESSGGSNAAEQAPLARDAVRAALASLQTVPESAIADKAMEHIAGSLGLLHGLAQKAQEAAAAPAPAAPAPQVSGTGATEKFQSPPETPSVAANPLQNTVLASEPIPSKPAIVDRPSDPAPAAPSGALDATLPTPTRSPVADIDQKGAHALASTQASVRVPVPSQAAAPAPAVQRTPAPADLPPPEAPAPSNSRHASLPPEDMPDGAIQVEANLGAHSPTNFYKGLSGNDVVDDGGLFVATYDIPAINSKLWISVNMPGGYEFSAVAVVRWVRESSAGDASPGFGCAFTSLSTEARQLIYRYVRNREPLFHDDL